MVLCSQGSQAGLATGRFDSPPIVRLVQYAAGAARPGDTRLLAAPAAAGRVIKCIKRGRIRQEA